MTSYVAFLRAINLGAIRKFPRDAVVAATEGAGFTAVQTHLNTGNVRVTTRLRSPARVEQVLEKAFLDDRGFEVPTVIFTPADLLRIVADADDIAGSMPDVGMQYVSLLRDEPPAAVRREAEAASTDSERLVFRGRAAHLLMAERDSYHSAALSNAWVEGRLGVATNRNLRVLRAITQKWC